MVQSVGTTAAQSAKIAQMKAQTAGKAAESDSKEKTDKAAEEQATAVKESYKKPDKLTADQLKEISDQRIGSFQKMLESMVGKQAKKFNHATFKNLNVSKADQLRAQAAISDGGEWSSDAVSKRILDMAKALSGGDKSKISELRNAVEKGFGAATKAWGSTLPGICQDTHDKVMQGFDDWEKEMSDSAE